MKTEEQLYTIPLGKAYDYKKSRRAIRAVDLVRTFVLRHAKSDQVVISMKVNEAIWSRSIEKPPRRIKVKVVKKEDTANVYLPDEKPVEIKAEAPKAETKEKPKEVKAEKKEETKTEVKKPEVKKEEPKEKPKPEVKKPEVKVEKKEEKSK